MTSIKYGTLKIDHIRDASGFFIGTNVQIGRTSETILNEGFGTIKGKNNKVANNKGTLKKNNS